MGASKDRRGSSKSTALPYTASPYTELEYFVILHGEVIGNQAFVVPPDITLHFKSGFNNTLLIDESLPFQKLLENGSDTYITGNICEDVRLFGSNKNDPIIPMSAGIIPINELINEFMIYDTNKDENLKTSFSMSELGLDDWYKNGNPISHNLSDVIRILRNKHPTEKITFHLLNCRNIYTEPYFGDCLGYIPPSVEGNTFHRINMCNLKNVPIIGDIAGFKLNLGPETFLIMVNNLTKDQKSNLISDIKNDIKNDKTLSHYLLTIRLKNNDTVYYYFDKAFDNLQEEEQGNILNYLKFNKPKTFEFIRSSFFDNLNNVEDIEIVLYISPVIGINCDDYVCNIENEYRKYAVTSELGLTNIEDKLNDSVREFKNINVYNLKIPISLTKNPIWSQLISSISNTTDIIKLTDLQPCLLVILNKFINNRDEYDEKLFPQIEKLDDKNFKSALELLKFGKQPTKRRHSRARKHRRSKKTIKRGRSLRRSAPKRLLVI